MTQAKTDDVEVVASELIDGAFSAPVLVVVVVGGAGRRCRTRK